jgi:hypothetical protein
MIISTVISHAVWCSKPDIFTHIAGVSDTDILGQIRSFLHSALRPESGAGTART